MDFTGERYVPGVLGEIAYEHLHRYVACLPAVAGLDVLDLACGEGYGSALLAGAAKRVVGVDIDAAAVEHASSRYLDRSNLSFWRRSAYDTGFAPHSFDAVVSFETLEHVDDQRAMLDEIKRVLRPRGILIMSTPDREIFNAVNGEKNPFHVKELSHEEFGLLLNEYFQAVVMWGQRAIVSSVLFPLSSEQSDMFAIAHSGMTAAEPAPPIVGLSPVYLVAVCSNEEATIPQLQQSMYYDGSNDPLTAYRRHIQHLEGLLQARDDAVP